MAALQAGLLSKAANEHGVDARDAGRWGALGSFRLRAPRPRTLVLGSIAVTALIVLHAAGGALGPYLVGFVYIVGVYPFVQRLARRGLPRWAAVIAVFGATLLVGLLFVGFVAGFLIQTTAFTASMHQWLSDSVNGLLGQLVAAGATRADDVARFYDATQELAGRITAGILGVVSPQGSGQLGILGSLFAFGTVPFWAFYLMKDWPRLSDELDRRLPDSWSADARTVMGSIGFSFSTWIRGQLTASVVAGMFTLIEFVVLGLLVNPVFLNVAFVMAAIGFAFELIPTIGPTIALIPYLLVGAVAGGPGMIAVFIGWVIAQQLENAWIVPQVQSRATDLHPAVILFVLVIGGAVDGLLGVLLSVPITSAAWRITAGYLPAREGSARVESRSDLLGEAPAGTVAADAA